MNKLSNCIVAWWPADYSPTYMLELDADFHFVRVVEVRDVPPWYPGSELYAISLDVANKFVCLERVICNALFTLHWGNVRNMGVFGGHNTLFGDKGHSGSGQFIFVNIASIPAIVSFLLAHWLSFTDG